MFSKLAIPFYENIGRLIGIIFVNRLMTTKFNEKFEETQRLVSVRMMLLEKIAEQLKNADSSPSDQGINKTLSKTLDDILGEISVLKGISPICSKCHKVKNEQGYWERIEQFISSRADIVFSHTYCDECYQKELKRLEQFEFMKHDD